jgi:hypothetical protein
VGGVGRAARQLHRPDAAALAEGTRTLIRSRARAPSIRRKTLQTSDGTLARFAMVPGGSPVKSLRDNALRSLTAEFSRIVFVWHPVCFKPFVPPEGMR